MHTGRQAKAADFAGKLAAAAKKKHERVETRTELSLPAELGDTIADLLTQVLYLHGEIAQIKKDLGAFYTRLGEKAA